MKEHLMLVFGEYSYNNLQDRGEYYFARKETKSVLEHARNEKNPSIHTVES